MSTPTRPRATTIQYSQKLSAPVKIIHNTVYRGGAGGDIVDDSGFATVLNNVGSAREGNSPAAPTHFLDAGRADFYPAPGSALVDAGEAVPEVAMDIDGNPRPAGEAPDHGAFERGAGARRIRSLRDLERGGVPAAP